MPKEKVLAIPVKETFASASTVNDPILDVAETPDGCTTAEPSIAADPSDEEKEIPLTKSPSKAVFIASLHTGTYQL